MKAARGFTLLELLIAIALFALLGVGTYRLLDSVLRADAATRQQELRLRELSRGMAAFERDLRQLLAGNQPGTHHRYQRHHQQHGDQCHPPLRSHDSVSLSAAGPWSVPSASGRWNRRRNTP